MRKKGMDKWGDKFIAFRSVMEVVYKKKKKNILVMLQQNICIFHQTLYRQAFKRNDETPLKTRL